MSAYNGGELDDAFVRIRPPLPPSSLGAQEPSLGAVDEWILDQVDITVAFLEPQRSPEIPVAIDAIDDTRARTRALLEEIGKMVVEGVAISAFVTAISGGFGGGASAAAVVAKIREKFPRFVALLTALRATVATAAARLERVLDDLADLRTRVGKWLKVPARDERGSATNPFGWLSKDARFEPSPKHAGQARGRASAGPRNGQDALEDSIAVNPATTTRRISYDPRANEFVVLDETVEGVFHGHVRSWGELTHSMQRALIDAGVVDRRGRAIGRGGS